MDFKKFVQEQNELFVSGHVRVNQYRKDWNSLTKTIKTVYEPLLKELEKNFTFELFRLMETKDIPNKKENENQNFISLCMGQHPNGITTSKTDKDGAFSVNMSVEKGGQLVFSQGPQGEVMVLMYACNSDELKFHDEYIVYKFYKSPDRITPEKLFKIIKFFFRFVYVSSYVGDINIIDRIRIAFIKWRSKFDVLKAGQQVLEMAKTVGELKSGFIGG